MPLGVWKKVYEIDTCGLYFIYITIVNDNSSVISKWHSSLIDAARVIIYNHNMFKMQATGVNVLKLFSAYLNTKQCNLS